MDRAALQRRLRGALRLGLWLDFRPAPGAIATRRLYEEHLALAARADELGCSAVLVSEHHATDDDYLPTPVLCLAAIAARTDSALLGSGVGLAPLWPPRILAEELSVLDLLSGGRALAGLGVGYADFDFAALGVDRRRRGAALDALLDELERGWRGDGRLSDGYPLSPQPSQPGGLPIMLGGVADAALRRIAERADVYFADANRDFRDIVGKWQRLSRIAGAAPKPLLVLGTYLWVDDDGGLWETEVAPAIAYQLSRYGQWSVDEHERTDDMVAPESLDRDKFLVGPPDELVERLRALLAGAPIECVCVWGRPPGVSHETALRNVERLAKEVMPAVAPPAHVRV